MRESEKLARIFKALSVETRVRMIQLLKNRVHCVGALSAKLDVTQGAVSQHLRILRDADVVVPEKRGHYIHYRLNEKTLLKWRNAVDRFLGKENEAEVYGEAKNIQEKGARQSVRGRRVAKSRRS